MSDDIYPFEYAFIDAEPGEGKPDQDRMNAIIDAARALGDQNGSPPKATNAIFLSGTTREIAEEANPWAYSSLADRGAIPTLVIPVVTDPQTIQKAMPWRLESSLYEHAIDLNDEAASVASDSFGAVIRPEDVRISGHPDRDIRVASRDPEAPTKTVYRVIGEGARHR